MGMPLKESAPMDEGKMEGRGEIFFINPLYTCGLFHCYMLDKSICHFRRVGSILSLFSFFDGWKTLLASSVQGSR